MVPKLRIPAALAENLELVPRIHMASHSSLTPFSGVHCPLWASTGTRHTLGARTNKIKFLSK